MLLVDELTKKFALIEPIISFFSDRLLLLVSKAHVFEKPFKFVLSRVIMLQVKIIDRYLPDKLLLFFIDSLDKYVPPKAIELVIEEVDRVIPNKIISSALQTADEYIPDSVASSRKASAAIAGVGKYVPDRIIPPESRDIWANLKMKFHIPTLLSRGQPDSHKD